MNEGSIVLTPLPQADGATKNRPALVLREMPPFGDLLVCGISTHVERAVVGFDEVLRQSDADFSATGLHSDSLVRLGFLAVLPRRRIAGAIGHLEPGRYERILSRLSSYLTRKIGEKS